MNRTFDKYLFTSNRLGFRNWETDDIPQIVAISADPEVMKYFPAPATREQTKEFVLKMQHSFSEKSYCYFAVDRLEDAKLIGFIGLMDQAFEASFTPCVDIGWRLGTRFWGMGYATEGATRCLEYAFSELGLAKVVSTAPKVNLPSVRIMTKIGMRKLLEFKHPRLFGNERLEDCVCYHIEKH